MWPVNATPLDATVISEMMPTHILNELDIVVLDIVGSTNDFVRERLAARGSRGMVAFAEQQTAGRGRRGKTWHSPAGANIYCSVGWQCQGALASLSGLSLAVGAILAESVATHLGIQLQLKWPNDLFYQERKLGGVLVELLGEQDGVHYHFCDRETMEAMISTAEISSASLRWAMKSKFGVWLKNFMA